MAILSFLRRSSDTRCKQVNVSNLQGLHAVLAPDVNMAYWQRAVDVDIQAFLQPILAIDFKPVNQSVSWLTVGPVIQGAFQDFNHNVLGREKLTTDVIQLTHEFLRIANVNQVRLHVRVVTNDACSRFHTDGYPIRLISSYLGQATEWVADADVNRSQLWLGKNEDIVPDANRIQRLNPFDVAILKGDPGFKTNRGIVHRSPAIEAAGEKRFVLRLDVNE